MTMLTLTRILVFIGAVELALGAKLSIQNGHFYFNNQQVFLNGANMAWASYGYDFGDNHWQYYPKSEYTRVIQELHKSGGNSLRVWVHVQGEVTPAFDSSGFVTGLDTQGTFLNEFKELLDIALANDVWIVPTLWNAAVDQDTDKKLDGLIKDTAKLQSYLDNALTPWVNAFKDHPALGSWDLMNEPEGMIIPNQQNADSCYDTTGLLNSGTGWAGERYSYQEMLRFLNWQAAAIKAADPAALVSVGVWNPMSNTDLFGKVNHYSDACLVHAGGKASGVMDYWQFHSYAWNNQFDNIAPFVHDAADYQTNKPIVIGEFWDNSGGGMTNAEMFQYVYNHGYDGAWSWDVRSQGGQFAAMATIKDQTVNGVMLIDL